MIRLRYNLAAVSRATTRRQWRVMHRWLRLVERAANAEVWS